MPTAAKKTQKHKLLLILIVFYFLFIPTSNSATCNCDEFDDRKELDISATLNSANGTDLLWTKKFSPLSQFSRIRLLFQATYSQNVNAVVWVYDQHGEVFDEFNLNEIEQKSGRWSKTIDGPSATVEIRGASSNISKFVVKSIEGKLTDSIITDSIVDGVEYFTNVRSNSPLNKGLYNIARLIIGTQKMTETLARAPTACTGFLISSDLLMTAAHCFKSEFHRCDSTIAVFGYNESLLDNTHARPCKKVIYSNRVLDIMVLRLGGTNKMNQKGLPFSSQIPSGELVIYQHPLGMQLRISQDKTCRVFSNHSDGAIFVDRAQGHVSGIALPHKCDTHFGSSGSPIFQRNSLALVGVHSSTNTRLGINKGIKSNVITDCLEISQKNNTLKVRDDYIHSILCQNEVLE